MLPGDLNRTKTHLFTEILPLCFADKVSPANQYIIKTFSATGHAKLPRPSPSRLNCEANIPYNSQFGPKS